MLFVAKVLVSVLIVWLTLLLAWILAYDKRNGFSVFFFLSLFVAIYCLLLR